MMHAQAGFDESAQPGGRVEVADVPLDRPQDDRRGAPLPCRTKTRSNASTSMGLHVGCPSQWPST
jgi:hypothetical protein